MAIQPDGKIVIGGSQASGFAVFRLNSNGTLDSSFGVGGIADTPAGPDGGGVSAIALQADGKIVAVGNNGFYLFAVLRYNSDGTLDHTFNGTGILYDNLSDSYGADKFDSVAIQADGKIVAAGSYTIEGYFGESVVARYNTDGTPDLTFNGTGKADLQLASSSGADSMALLATGEIVIAGASASGGRLEVLYHPDGSLDTSFGTGGYEVGVDGGVVLYTVLAEPDGSFVVGGVGATFQVPQFDTNFLARYSAQRVGTLQTGQTSMLDVDGNGKVDALTDGILMLRYFFGFTGTALTSGALGVGATRTSPAAIQAFLSGYFPNLGHLWAGSDGPGAAPSDLVTSDELQTTAAAIARWEATDLSSLARARLENAQVQIADLGGSILGETHAARRMVAAERACL